MDVVVKQSRNSDGHKGKSRAICFFRNSSDKSCSQTQSFIQLTWLYFEINPKLYKDTLWSNQVRGICYKCSQAGKL